MNSNPQPEINIKKHTTPDDRRRKVEDSIVLKKDGETITNRHPIWEFNPGYAGDVVFKMEAIQAIKEKADVIRVVGYPLLRAALLFFDLGITTVDSSPHANPGFLKNKREDQFFAYIDVEVESLNSQNNTVAKQLVVEDKAEKLDAAYHMHENEADLWVYRLFFPITSSTTVDEMDQTAYEVANRFVSNSQ